VDHGQTLGGGRMERTVGLAGVFAICTGAMFSSGFFLLPGLAADETGPSIPLAYLAAGVLVLPALLSIAELSSAMPRAGGPYYFLARGLGPFAGTIGALAKYVQLLFKGAFAFVGVGAYLSLVVEVPIRPVAIGLVVVFTAVNLVGVGQTTRAEMALVAVLLALLGYLVFAGGVELLVTEQRLAERFDPPLPFGVQGFLSAVALVFVSYAGVGQVASVSEEVRDPSRSIPRGMLASLGVATVFYALGTFIMVALVAPVDLRDDPTPVATTVERFTVLPLPTLLVVVAALAAFASTGNAAILSAARYPLAMARDQLVWRRFAVLDRRSVPRTSVLTTGSILVITLLLFDIEGIAKLASAFLLLVFVGMCLVVMVFRESGVEEYSPGFRSPLYPWLQLLGIGIYTVLIFESGIQAIGLILALLLGGSLWYGTVVRHRVSRSGAVHRLFARLAERGERTPQEHGPWLSRLAGHPLDDVLGRAMLLDVEGDDGLDQVARQAADALADRVGGDRHELARQLQEAVRPWASPVDAGVAISPVLLRGIEQAEMVLIRVEGGIEVDDRRIEGFIFVVDDERSSARLLDLVSQLTAATHQSGFGRAWRQAQDAQGLGRALAQDVRAVTIQLDGDRTELVGRRVADAALPAGSLVALIRRAGVTIVPDGDEYLEDGDQVTFLVEASAVDEVKEQVG